MSAPWKNRTAIHLYSTHFKFMGIMCVDVWKYCHATKWNDILVDSFDCRRDDFWLDFFSGTVTTTPWNANNGYALGIENIRSAYLK